MMMVHQEVFVTIMFTIMCAHIDAEHLNDGDYIEDHTGRWMQRFAFALAIGIGNHWHILATGLLFWALFDQTLNFLRENISFWHVGNTAKTDRFFSKRKKLYIASKVICLALSLYLFLSF